MDFVTVAHHYRGLVALNTLGVKLLELGQFLQAQETFTDAITEVKVALGFTDTSMETDCCSSCTVRFESEVDTKVNKANNHAATLPPRNMFSIQTLTHSMHGTCGVTIPDWELFGKHIHETFFPIRMEVEGTLDSSKDFAINKQSLDLESAIILHNMGVSFILIAKESPGESQPLMLTNGVHVLELSHTLLKTLQENPLDSELLNTVLQTESVVLHSMIPVLKHLGRQEEAETHSNRLSYLCVVIEDFHGRMRTMFKCVVSSAAAA